MNGRVKKYLEKEILTERGENHLLQKILEAKTSRCHLTMTHTSVWELACLEVGRSCVILQVPSKFSVIPQN